MEQRLKDMGINDVEVTTIHVWSRNLLQDFSIKYNFKIKILQEPQIKDILSELIEDYLKHSKLRSINIDIVITLIWAIKIWKFKNLLKKKY
jgi:hypothetical protein